MERLGVWSQCDIIHHCLEGPGRIQLNVRLHPIMKLRTQFTGIEGIRAACMAEYQKEDEGYLS